jgi:hypothetical protein
MVHRPKLQKEEMRKSKRAKKRLADVHMERRMREVKEDG